MSWLFAQLQKKRWIPQLTRQMFVPQNHLIKTLSGGWMNHLSIKLLYRSERGAERTPQAGWTQTHY